ncbi:MAG TPA: UTP--glucose-1-phosphate uridylyltransferase [Dehalococcoidia bacterium]|nr:UTP--glucose-1-phosphate uridylyltransferase [Dehalococcoidia bacterium]
MKVRKAVILAAGFGTRFLPATKTVPKEMLTLFDRPVIQYIVDEALAAGIEQIVMVTSSFKRAMEDHFDHNFELEQSLEATGKKDQLVEVRRLADIDMVFVRQKERLGNGHAVMIAREIVGHEPFAVFFPDDVIFHPVPAIRQLIDVFDARGGTVLAVQQVPNEQVSLYGIIDPAPVTDRLYEVKSVIEKPSVQGAPSNLATVGRFVCTPELFDALDTTPPGRAGEIWLMDAFDNLRRTQTVYAYEYEGVRFDCGQPLGLLRAAIYQGLRDPDAGSDLRSYLQPPPLD